MYNYFMKSIIVKKYKKMDLISYLNYIFPSLLSSNIYKALRKKDIRINDIKINKNVILKENDKIDLYIKDNILFNLPKTIDIIYEDNNILVVYKPQGILSNNEEKIKNNNLIEPTLEDLIKEQYPNIKICHRLDRNTAGLIIFAKNNNSYIEILKGFKNFNIKKEYIAYVSGTNFNKNHEILEKYLLKNEKNGYCKIYDYNIKNSQKIITEYFCLKSNILLDYSILRIIIHTGKTHQIRAQLKAINHPIIGDPKYGKNQINKKFNIHKQLLFATDYSFNFKKDSYLYYLNNLNIKLDKKYYTNKLGSD